jgi:hypothetical protein
MSSNLDMIGCPHNNTECILQAVVALLNEVREKNAEFNWDPLSFVFTAVTGVVAACFAGIAILQAFFAADPGRLKASRYAIGPWAKFTKRSFDWQEWRFRSVTQTPVIVVSSPDGFEAEHKYSITESSEYQPAGWNALLSRLSLDKPELWAKKPLSADHLPQELPAVPAYGNIAAIITLAIAQAGGNCKLVPDQDSEFLMVRGDTFQLRLRKHAVLGTVATFETYPSPRITFNSRVGGGFSHVDGNLHFLIRYSLGYVPLDFKGSDWMLLVEPEDCAPGAFMFPGASMIAYQRWAQGYPNPEPHEAGCQARSRAKPIRAASLQDRSPSVTRLLRILRQI